MYVCVKHVGDRRLEWKVCTTREVNKIEKYEITVEEYLFIELEIVQYTLLGNRGTRSLRYFFHLLSGSNIS